jgi:hypothetical protein
MPSLYGVSVGEKLGKDFQFDQGSYSSFYTLDINFLNLPVYRAETKEEFAFDALFLAGSLATGGWTSGLKFAASKLESD